MPDDITLRIDGIEVTVPQGTTLLQAAELIERRIPSICYHEHCKPNAVCRTCVVELQGKRLLAASCVTEASAGMKVFTQTDRVKRSRRVILELLNSTVDLSDAPEIIEILNEYNVSTHKISLPEEIKSSFIDDNPMYVRDYSKCILCWRCVQVCADDAQYTYAINFSGRGFDTQISTFFERPLLETTCVFCGQCVGVCPTGALKARREWLLESGFSPEKTMFSEKETP